MISILIIIMIIMIVLMTIMIIVIVVLNYFNIDIVFDIMECKIQGTFSLPSTPSSIIQLFYAA